MKVAVAPAWRAELPSALLAFAGPRGPLLSEGSPPVEGRILGQAAEDGFSGKAGETCILRAASGRPAARVLLLGLGKRADVDPNTLRLAAASAVRRLSEAHWESLQIAVPGRPWTPAQAAGELAEGILLAAYRFDRYKTRERPDRALQRVVLHVPRLEARTASAAVSRAVVLAEATNRARDWINEPAADKSPSDLARRARGLSGRGLTCRVLDVRRLRALGAGAILGVGQGSARPPVLVHMTYRGPSPRRRVALVGKGIVFDSGGLSLKPAEGMMTMKYDMAGAAVVFAVLAALPRLRPSVEVHGIATLAENMPGPAALRPGDVLRAMNGRTIEVLNTDAEGRLVLADGLSYAARLKVDEVVDVATLTGAVSVALGKAQAALLTDHPGLETVLRAAAERAGEKLWPLPLERTYKEQIKSKVADLKNIGNAGEAGTIVGGLFLQEFAGDRPWAHIDMASVGWSPLGSLLSPPGATGAMVRTLLNYLAPEARA